MTEKNHPVVCIRSVPQYNCRHFHGNSYLAKFHGGQEMVNRKRLKDVRISR